MFDEPCGDNDDMNCTLDDAGVNFTCGATAPAITGNSKPLEYLTTLNNLSAKWNLDFKEWLTLTMEMVV